jgi:hypothetical protein
MYRARFHSRVRDAQAVFSTTRGGFLYFPRSENNERIGNGVVDPFGRKRLSHAAGIVVGAEEDTIEAESQTFRDAKGK